MSTRLAAARQLFAKRKYHSAKAILEEAIGADPSQAEASALLGSIYCLLQREFDAVPLLEASATTKEGKILGQTLCNYFYCRDQIAKKFNLSDSEGRELAQRVFSKFDSPSDSVGIRISACLIAKNESKHLARCLSSIQGRVDEIIVVDTGSTDDTIAIAERFGATLGHFSWCDDYSAARNESLRLATGHWILWLDADEEITPESWNIIYEAVTRPQFGGYCLRINNLLDVRGASTYTHAPVRLFRKLPGTQFTGRIHEQITPSIDAAGLPCADLQGASITHYGYQPDSMQEKNKIERTISMLEREVRENPEDAFHWFNLANAFSVGGRLKECETASRQCLKRLDPSSSFGATAYQILASALIGQSRFNEAIAICNEAESKNFGSIPVLFEKAHAQFRARDFESALQSIHNCLSTEWPIGETGDYGIVTHKGFVLKAQILIELNRVDEALALTSQALQVDPEFDLALCTKGLALEILGQFDQAKATYDSVATHSKQKPRARLSAIRCLKKQGLWEEACSQAEILWREHPNVADAWVSWLDALQNLGRIPDILTAFEEFAENHELTPDLLVNWGRHLAAVGNHDRALHCITEAIRREPNNMNAYFNAGDVLYSLGDFQDAAQMYESGLRLNPSFAQGWFVLGNTLFRLGLFQAAETAYVQTLTLAPNHAEASHNLESVREEMLAA